MNNYKNFKINLSSTFMVRSRCKKCKSGPLEYIYSNNRSLYIIRRIPREYARMSTYHFHSMNLNKVDDIRDFIYQTSYKGYHPTIYRSRGNRIPHNKKEYMACDCGHTMWAFNVDSVINCPEVFNRKSREYYPKDLY
jgi:hypothetical protein